MSIQILSYEFLGPIPLADWGPPMEKLVYLVLSRDGDKFNILYVEYCEKTQDRAFFVQHPQFKCWTSQSSEDSLHLAILPMFESSPEQCQNVVQKIVTHYKPACNSEIKKEPEYTVKRSENVEKFNCPCCGSEMKPEQLLEKSTIYRCTSCGISDTRLC